MSPEHKLRVVEILREEAECLKRGHTVNGEWDDVTPEDGRAHRYHDEMLALAEELEVNLAGDTSGTRPGAEATAWLIWSNEHRAWWAADRDPPARHGRDLRLDGAAHLQGSGVMGAAALHTALTHIRARVRAIADGHTKVTDEQMLRDAADLIGVLAHIVDGKTIAQAFGAPGDWGYGTNLGKGLLDYLRSPDLKDASPRDTGHESDRRPKGDNEPPITVEDSRPVGLAPLTEAEELERAFINRCVRGPAPDDPDYRGQ